MICANCGKELPDHVKFCKYCGARIVPAPESAPAPEAEDSAPGHEPAFESAAAEPEPEETDSDESPAKDSGIKDSEAKAASAEKKSGFFSRNRKPDKEKAEMQEKIDGLEDKVRRQMAEFDNYRKRTEKEKDQMFSMGERSVIEKMLPIVDNFERGFDTIEEEDQDDAFVAGMQKIYQQLIRQLDALGVKPIEAVGQEFDPEFHNAVMQVESDQYESGVVAQELQRGYLYHDQVIRHSMVAVVQ